MIATDPENLLEGYDKLTVPDQVSSLSLLTTSFPSHHTCPSNSHYLPFFRPLSVPDHHRRSSTRC